MSNLTTAISVQVDTKDKELATNILKSLGISMSTAINMYLKQIIKKDGIPFEVVNHKDNYDIYKYFTKEELNDTAKELAYMETHLNEYKSYDNKEDLKKALLSDD